MQDIKSIWIDPGEDGYRHDRALTFDNLESLW